jgi:hypothetical protein
MTSALSADSAADHERGKTSVSDNTVTTVVTFTMPTGPSSFMAGLSFKGSSDDSTDAAAVWIQGILKCVRVSGGTVTAEWIETATRLSRAARKPSVPVR